MKAAVSIRMIAIEESKTTKSPARLMNLVWCISEAFGLCLKEGLNAEQGGLRDL